MVKTFFNNVKKGGIRMKKGLIAAGAAAVAGVIGTIALAIVGAQDDDKVIDADYEEIEENTDTLEDISEDIQEATEE